MRTPITSTRVTAPKSHSAGIVPISKIQQTTLTVCARSNTMSEWATRSHHKGRIAYVALAFALALGFAAGLFSCLEIATAALDGFS